MAVVFVADKESSYLVSIGVCENLATKLYYLSAFLKFYLEGFLWLTGLL